MFIQRPSDNLILENPSNALERGGGGGGGGGQAGSVVSASNFQAGGLRTSY